MLCFAGLWTVDLRPSPMTAHLHVIRLSSPRFQHGQEHSSALCYCRHHHGYQSSPFTSQLSLQSPPPSSLMWQPLLEILMSIMLPLCGRSLRKSSILRRCVPSPRLRCGPESGVPDRKDYCREISDLFLCRRVRAGGTSPDRGPSNQMSLLEPSGWQQSRSQAKRGTEPEPFEHAEVQGAATCTITPCGV
jgi:hypothetical protein